MNGFGPRMYRSMSNITSTYICCCILDPVDVVWPHLRCSQAIFEHDDCRLERIGCAAMSTNKSGWTFTRVATIHLRDYDLSISLTLTLGRSGSHRSACAWVWPDHKPNDLWPPGCVCWHALKEGGGPKLALLIAGSFRSFVTFSMMTFNLCFVRRLMSLCAPGIWAGCWDCLLFGLPLF